MRKPINYYCIRGTIMGKHTKEIQQCYALVDRFFGGDKRKTFQWFTMANPCLGGAIPLDMIKAGRIKKLHDFISSSIFESTVRE
jgi:hypothetical protein